MARTDASTSEPSDAETRAMRRRLHDEFDPLWKDRRDGQRLFSSRTQAYVWLAGQLGIPRDACHIGHFGKATCKLALSRIERLNSNRAANAAGKPT